MRTKLKILCGNTRLINLLIQGNEKLSMLITGISRMGKTYFAALLGAMLISLGYAVHLIDLGYKWSDRDKEYLLSEGAVMRRLAKERLCLTFNSVNEMCGCAGIIVNALHIRSTRAVMVMKDAIKDQLVAHEQQFALNDLMEYLKSAESKTVEDKDWRLSLWEALDSCGDIPNIIFRLDKDENFSTGSMIWDFSGLDDTYAQIEAYLVTFCLYCQQKRRSVEKSEAKKVFVIIDEFQNLDCDRKSIIGKCLTEGQKYGLALILITQFLKGNFSEPEIEQFKQGGFRFYFRLTEEEAAKASRELAGNSRDREHLYSKLVTLPRGQCLMKGPHMIQGSNKITEVCRFVEIMSEAVKMESKRKCAAPKIKVNRRFINAYNTSMAEAEHIRRGGSGVYRDRYAQDT